MSPRLLAVGEAMVRLSPEGGRPLVDSRSLELSVGGAELNVAIAATCMDLESTWLTSLPEGVLADMMMRHARSHGVEPVVVRGDGRVGLYFAEIAGDPRSVNVTYDRDYSAIRTLSSAQVDAVVDIEQFTAVFSTGITLSLGEGPREVVLALFKAAQGRRTYFEVNHRTKLATAEQLRTWVEEVLPNVDVLFASSFDLTDLLGAGEDVRQAADKLMTNFDLEYVVVADRVGRVGSSGRNSLRVLGEGVDAAVESSGLILDPIGAGDAGAGVFIACLEQGMDPIRAAEFAVRASAWVQTHPGDAAQFRRTDIAEFDGRRIRR